MSRVVLYDRPNEIGVTITIPCQVSRYSTAIPEICCTLLVNIHQQSRKCVCASLVNECQSHEDKAKHLTLKANSISI